MVAVAPRVPASVNCLMVTHGIQPFKKVEVAIFPPQKNTTMTTQPSTIQVVIPSTIPLHLFPKYSVKVSICVENDVDNTSSETSTSSTSDSSHTATCGGETGAQRPLRQIYEYYNETHVSSNSRSSQTSSPSSHPPPPYTPRMGKSTLLSYLLSLTCYPSGLACCCDMTLSFGGKDWEYVDLCYLDPMCC